MFTFVALHQLLHTSRLLAKAFNTFYLFYATFSIANLVHPHHPRRFT